MLQEIGLSKTECLENRVREGLWKEGTNCDVRKERKTVMWRLEEMLGVKARDRHMLGIVQMRA